jgi:plastocyanin
MPADVSKRLVLPTILLVLVAAGCGEPTVGEVDFGSGRQFVPEVADSIDNVGIAPAVALDADGIPFVSYLGFPAELEEGEIPVPRPVGAPFVPGVLLASQSEGVWNRGAVAMYQDPPDRVSVPFGPATVESLAHTTPETTAGTDITVAENGTIHVVWAAADGIWYASGPSPFTATQVTAPELTEGGAPGWPSVTLDESGSPWIAATVATSGGQQVIAATPDGDAWDVQTVAELPACTDCDVPARTGIAASPDGPVVVYADPAGGVTAARPDGRRWTTEVVDAGADGTGIAVAADADGALTASYYDSPGSVSVATSHGAGWRVGEASSSTGSGEAGVDGLGTGVAVSDDGTVFLTYVDPGENAVVLAASADDGPFEPIETRGTEAGRWPDVAVTPDGATASLAWYAPENEDLAFGTVTDVSGVTLAAPSPPFAVGTLAPGGDTDCGPDTVPVLADLEVTAATGAVESGFEETCLVAPAGEKLTLSFDNQDPGQSHNAAFFPDSASNEELFSSGEPVLGPATQGPEPVDEQSEGTYFFKCIVHPDTMNGTFVVTKAPKK